MSKLLLFFVLCSSLVVATAEPTTVCNQLKIATVDNTSIAGEVVREDRVFHFVLRSTTPSVLSVAVDASNSLAGISHGTALLSPYRYNYFSALYTVQAPVCSRDSESCTPDYCNKTCDGGLFENIVLESYLLDGKAWVFVSLPDGQGTQAALGLNLGEGLQLSETRCFKPEVDVWEAYYPAELSQESFESLTGSVAAANLCTQEQADCSVQIYSESLAVADGRIEKGQRSHASSGTGRLQRVRGLVARAQSAKTAKHRLRFVTSASALYSRFLATVLLTPESPLNKIPQLLSQATTKNRTAEKALARILRVLDSALD